MRKLTTSDRVRIVRCLTEGCSVRATSRLTGFSKDSILKLTVDLGEVCADFHNEMVQNVDSKRVECDELWAFVGAKAATIKRRKDLQTKVGIGDAWAWVAIDADTKLVISYLVGHKGPESATAFTEDLASRVANRLQVSTDGDKNYFTAVPAAFGGEVDFGRVIKTYGNPGPNGKIGSSPLVCVSIKRQSVMGNPVEKHISTSYIERQNLTVRMSNKRFARSTNAHSKKWANLCHATAINYFFYNWIRVHSTLRQTPAMAAKLTDRIWSFEDLIGLLEAKETAAIGTTGNKRGPYRVK